MKRSYCIVCVGPVAYGIDIGRVQEILRQGEVTQVPQARAAVRGLLGLRGTIVPVIDLRRSLGQEEPVDGMRRMNVVIRTPDGLVGILVDEVEDIVELDEDSCEPPPETFTGPARQLIPGVHKLAQRLLLVLDVDKLIVQTMNGAHAEGEIKAAPITSIAQRKS